jgi:RNA polymerase sigma factor (sigma-70 family)
MTDKELEKIYNEAYRAVYWTAMSLLKNEADAEDIVQDTFVTLIESYDTLNDKDKVIPWLKKIAANKCLNRLTRSKTDTVEDEFFDDVEAIAEDFLPDSIVESEEARKIIMDIINNKLSDDIRRTLILFYFDDLSTKEIAEALGVPEGTVRRRLNFARNKIKKEVEKYEEENDTKLFGMAIPFLTKLFIKESEQVAIKPMPASLANLSASAEASGKGVNIKASTEAIKKGTDIMKTKILIGSIAAVVAVGATIGIIAGVVSKNKKNRRADPEETGYSQQEESRDYPEDSVWTEKTESETTATTQQITEDSFFVRMDDMTAAECADNLWKTSNVYVGMTKEEYSKNIIIPEEFTFFSPDDSFSWSFNGIGSGSKRYISVLQVFSAGDCSPVFDDYGNLSLVKIQMFIESEEFGDELIDKLKEKFTAEGYALESDNTNGDMRTARFEGRGQSFAIVRSCLGNQNFIGITIPLVSG